MTGTRARGIGLSARITVLTFLSVTTAVVLVSLIAITGVYRSVSAERSARLEAFESLIVGSLDARFGGAERAIGALASALDTSGPESLPTHTQLHALADDHTDTFDEVVVAVPGGVISSAGDVDRFDLRRAETIRARVTSAGRPVLVWDDGSGEGRLWAGAVIGARGSSATVFARVRTAYLGRTLDDVVLASGSPPTFVVDAAGARVLMAAGAATVDTASVVYSREDTSGVRGAVMATSRGVRVLSGVWTSITPGHGLDWRVVVMEPESDALARTSLALAPALLAMLLVIAIAVVGALIYSRRMLVPLTILEQRARDVAAGGYIRPVRVVRDDEMGRVAEAFNDMGVRLNSLQDLSKLLSTASDLDSVLDAALSAIGRILGAADAAILLADSSGEALSLVRGRGLASDDETLLVQLDESSPLVRAFLENAPVSFPGDPESRSGSIYRLFGADAERAGVAVPLSIGSEVLGAAVVLTPGRRAFTSAQIETLRVFGANAAMAVRTSRLFADERLSRSEAEVLRTVAELTVRPADLGTALETVARVAADVLGYAGSAVALEGRQQLGMGAPSEADGRMLEVWRAVEVDRGAPDVPADTPIVIEDVRRRPEFVALVGHTWGSALFIPILQGTIARGAIVLHDRARMRRPSARHMGIAETIGQQSSLAISNAHLLQQARTRAANLETVFRISQAVSSELQIDAVLSRVLDVVQKILSADAVALMSYDPGRNVVETSMARGLTSDEMLRFFVPPGEDIPGRVFDLGIPLSYGDLSVRTTPLARAAVRSGFESLIAVPLMARGRPIGVLAVYARAAAVFSGEDVELLLTFASQAALAIDTAALYGKEHHVASVLQESILPERLPEIAGLEMASFYLPCGPEAEIGGDYYDVFTSADGRTVLAIGDVCGKGVAAATKTSMVKYTLRGLIGAGAGPGQALAELNRQVAATGDPADIVTMWVGVLDRATGRLTYSDGGHPPALLRRAATRAIERLGATGPLLGAVTHARYEERTVEVGPGDMVLLYTDGVTEARRGTRLFGEGRVRRVLKGGSSVHACLDALLHAVTVHAAGPLRDDAAALVVRRAVTFGHPEGVNDGHEG